MRMLAGSLCMSGLHQQQHGSKWLLMLCHLAVCWCCWWLVVWPAASTHTSHLPYSMVFQPDCLLVPCKQQRCKCSIQQRIQWRLQGCDGTQTGDCFVVVCFLQAGNVSCKQRSALQNTSGCFAGAAVCKQGHSCKLRHARVQGQHLLLVDSLAAVAYCCYPYIVVTTSITTTTINYCNYLYVLLYTCRHFTACIRIFCYI